jgi:uncharacterized protein (TIGR00299 family) protein
MNKILYFECNSGISGDMTVGALLDLGADKKVLLNALNSLMVDGYHLHFGRTVKCGLDAYDFDVQLDHTESPHEHIHEHRNLDDIYEIIERLDSNSNVKRLAKKMFDIIAIAESRAHGIPVEKVHFHEIGAIDSIVDIIGAAVCVDNLGINEIVVSPLAEGFGNSHCQHGIIPVPVPATANIASAHHLKLRITNTIGEMVTPTGAAIAAALKTKENLPASFHILKIGLGAGKKDFAQANVLRIMVLEDTTDEEPAAKSDNQMWLLESNIDDSSGEILGFVMGLLMDAGAADIWYTPVYMKKNRPAYMISLICRDEELDTLEDILFTYTTTIGVRKHLVSRTILHRESKNICTDLGEAEVKICTHKEMIFFYPEYESIKKICNNHKLEYQTVYNIVREEARKLWGTKYGHTTAK